MSLTSVIIALLPVVQLAVAEAPKLQHNPFVRPNLGAPLGDRGAALNHDQTLRATLVAGAHSLANIDGALVGIGELVGDAKVIEIRERSVILQRNKDRYTLNLDDPKEAQENEE